VLGRGSGWLRALAAVVTAAAGLSLAASHASAAPVASPAVSNVVIEASGPPGEYISKGVTNEFDPSNATVTGTATSSGINLSVLGGTTGLWWDFIVDPAAGKAFQDGYYPQAQRPISRASGSAGLDISTDGSGCNSVTGAFDIRDLALSGTRITRLDLLFTQFCDGATGPLFGEIRIGEPQPSGMLVSSSAVIFPSPGAGAPRMTVPLYIRNRGSAHVLVSGVTVSGYAAGDYRVTGHNCSGKVLAPRASCALSLSFAPSAAGPRNAALRFKLGATAVQVPLDALVPVGATSLTMSSQPGDFVGEGKTWNFNVTNAGFYFEASPTGLTQFVQQDGGWVWTASLAPATGHTLAVGNYPAAAKQGPGNALDVGGNNGCDVITGSFTVKQSVFTGSLLQHFDATFVQHCEGAAPALTGEIKYHSAAVVTAPPGVGSLSTKRSGVAVKLTWKNPAPSRYRYTVVRVEPGRPGAVAPVAGIAAYAGNGQQAMIGGLKSGATYTLVVYAVDQYGNVSAPAARVISG
jgi:hypothetical protein